MVGPYPETTGYIIPTFLAYADATGDGDARDRALRMADWECAVQLPSGAVVSGFAGDSDEPAVFNTGQCLFGWATAYAAAGTPAIGTSAERAAQWLIEQPGAGRRLAAAAVGPGARSRCTRTTRARPGASPSRATCSASRRGSRRRIATATGR